MRQSITRTVLLALKGGESGLHSLPPSSGYV
jgi:hypothetical protein